MPRGDLFIGVPSSSWLYVYLDTIGRAFPKELKPFEAWLRLMRVDQHDERARKKVASLCRLIKELHRFRQETDSLMQEKDVELRQIKMMQEIQMDVHLCTYAIEKKMYRAYTLCGISMTWLRHGAKSLKVPVQQEKQTAHVKVWEALSNERMRSVYNLSVLHRKLCAVGVESKVQRKLTRRIRESSRRTLSHGVLRDDQYEAMLE